MNDEPELTKKDVEDAIEREVSMGVKEEIVDIYEDLFQTIWDRIMPTLGVVTTVTIMERAIYGTRKQFEAMEHLKVTDEGLDFSELRKRVGEKQKPVLNEGFKELVASLFDILAKLTGNVLVRHLESLVEGKV